jgi:hypothetical protein
MTDPDEAQLSKLAKKMLATPPRKHEDMKLGARQSRRPIPPAVAPKPNKGNKTK